MGLNEKLQDNDVLVKIEYNWYRLDSVDIKDGMMPIIVSDEDGVEYEFDLADVDEIDSPVEKVCDIFGVA